MENILIVGAGGHGRSIAESILLKGEYNLVGFLDDSYPENKNIWSYPILGNTSDLEKFNQYAAHVIVAIGNNKMRELLQNKLLEAKFSLASIIHPSAITSPTSVIGVGVAIMAGAILGTEAKLGNGVIVNCGAVVDHHCVVEDFGHLGVNSCMSGGTVLGKSAWIQAGCSLGYGVKIESNSIVTTGLGISV